MALDVVARTDAPKPLMTSDDLKGAPLVSARIAIGDNCDSECG